jgi:hypothetical protein
MATAIYSWLASNYRTQQARPDPRKASVSLLTPLIAGTYQSINWQCGLWSMVSGTQGLIGRCGWQR